MTATKKQLKKRERNKKNKKKQKIKEKQNKKTKKEKIQKNKIKRFSKSVYLHVVIIGQRCVYQRLKTSLQNTYLTIELFANLEWKEFCAKKSDLSLI